MVRNRWATRLARFGLAAYGIVYMVIGLLAIQVANGNRRRAAGAEGALRSISRQPYGEVLLALIGLGLFGFVLWRLVQAIRDPEHEGTAGRIGNAVSAAVYGGIALFAVSLAFGSDGGNGTAGVRTWTARVLAMPLGRWWLFLLAGAVVVFALKQLRKAYTAEFEDRLALPEMSAGQRLWARRIGRAGYTALGMVLLIVAFFLFEAAADGSPGRARGLDGALNALAGQPYGPWLLGFTGAGLIAYGGYRLVEARFRVIRT